MIVGYTSTNLLRAYSLLLLSPLHIKHVIIAAAANPRRTIPTKKNPTPSSYPPQAFGLTYQTAVAVRASHPINLPYLPITGASCSPFGKSLWKHHIKYAT